MARDEIPEVFDRSGELIDAANRLTDAIHTLGTDSGRQFESQAVSIRRTRRMQRALGIGLLVEVLILAACGFALVAILANEHRIDSLTNRLNISQTVTRQNSLCPLYQLLLDANTPAAAAAAAAAHNTQYAHAVTIIENGYRALDCKQFTTAEPPSPTPNPVQ